MSLDKKKFKACMILAGLGDVIGFNNGIYEFNNSNEFSINTIGNNYIDEGSNYSNYIIFDFINISQLLIQNYREFNLVACFVQTIFSISKKLEI
jgi:hypothetical protein